MNINVKGCTRVSFIKIFLQPGKNLVLYTNPWISKVSNVFSHVKILEVRTQESDFVPEETDLLCSIKQTLSSVLM